MNKQEIEKAIAYWKEFKAEIPELKASYPDAGLGEQEEFVELAISALTRQLNNGWIPVSERLPEKYGLYIVSVYYSDWICDYGTEDESHKEPEDVVLMAEYRKGMNGSHKWYLHEEDGEITINGNEKICDKPDYWSTYIKAWKPLTEPYKEDVPNDWSN